MSRIKSRDTSPELIVRSLVYSLGFRYRLNVRQLVGKPDLVFRKLKKVIFVHGCFWHLHRGCKHSSIPKTRTEFWKTKLEENEKRDAMIVSELVKDGWEILTVWECETKDKKRLSEKITGFLK